MTGCVNENKLDSSALSYSNDEFGVGKNVSEELLVCGRVGFMRLRRRRWPGPCCVNRVVLYRTEDGTAVALEDRCCHRALPLSMGKVVGDRLQCGYHGLEFDSGGACVRVPGQAQIPPGASVRSYPLVERWKYLWIWMGDPALADEALIPNWWWFDHPEWEVVKGKYLRLDCNYELITDNLLDLSHLSYVHLQTLGTSDITEFPIRTEREKNMIRMTRWIVDRPAPPMFQKLGKFAGTVDRWQIVEDVFSL